MRPSDLHKCITEIYLLNKLDLDETFWGIIAVLNNNNSSHLSQYNL